MQFNESESPARHSDSPVVSLRAKVFGIGWAKTGTTTLGRCFEILGYNHQSQNLSLVPQILRGDFAKSLRIAAGKESFEDWPWPLVYREMDAAFPGSRFVLTTRAPERWIASYRTMLAAENPPPPEVRTIRCQLFGGDPATASDEELLARFLSQGKAGLLARGEPRESLLLMNFKDDRLAGIDATDLSFLLECDSQRHPEFRDRKRVENSRRVFLPGKPKANDNVCPRG